MYKYSTHYIIISKVNFNGYLKSLDRQYEMYTHNDIKFVSFHTQKGLIVTSFDVKDVLKRLCSMSKVTPTRRTLIVTYNCHPIYFSSSFICFLHNCFRFNLLTTYLELFLPRKKIIVHTLPSSRHSSYVTG